MSDENHTTLSPLAAAEDVVSSSRRQTKPRKGYGRRFSINASKASSSSSGGGRGAKAKLFGRARYGSSPSFDYTPAAGAAGGESLDSANCEDGTPAMEHDNSASSSIASNNYSGSNRSETSLIDDLDKAIWDGREPRVKSKAKNKRPKLPLPPSSASASAAAASKLANKNEETMARRSIFTKTDLSAFEFEPEAEEVMKRPKIRRSQSALTSATSSSLFEENLHPNDTSLSPQRRSSCAIVDKKVKALSQESTFGNNNRSNKSNSNKSEKGGPLATRSSSRRGANPRKRIATSGTDASSDDGIGFHHELEPSPPKIPATRSSSSSTFSSSTATNCNSVQSGGSSTESFSTLAMRGSSHCWANINKHHARSFSETIYPNQRADPGATNTPYTESSSSSSHIRSYSQPGGVDLSGMKPASKFSSIFSPGAMSTPSVRSISSRRRRGIFTSTPLSDGEFGGEDVEETNRDPSSGSISGGAHSYISNDGSLRSRTRSRIFSPPSIDHAIDEERNVVPMSSMLSPPSLFGASLNEEICLTANDGSFTDSKEDEARDVESDNESMISTSDNSDDSSSSSGEDYCPMELKEMSDDEIFDSKSSYEDFKFLTKTLIKWSNSLNCKSSASMGLNNGCLIAVPHTWNCEHRLNFNKWVVVAFGFKVGSVGGAQGGSFLRCSDAEGKDTLAKLRRILIEYKAGRLATSAMANASIELPAETNDQSTMLFSPLPDNVTPRAGLGIKLKPTRQSSISLSREPNSVFPFLDDFVEEQLSKDMNDKAFIDEKKEQEKVPANAVKKMLRPSKPKTKAKKSTLLCFRSSISPAVGSARKKPAPRRSNEHAINGADFMNHLHGASPSPVALPLRRLRSRANKIQTQPRMPSVEVPDQGHHPYLSPHPRNNSLAQQTPSRLDFLETPMPKQVENWGSRPVFGKDWGESLRCGDDEIDACSKIFAKSWFSSGFRSDKDLSNQYRMTLTEDDETFLSRFFQENEEDTDYDEDAESFSGSDFDDFADSTEHGRTPAPMCQNLKLSRSDSVGGSALALLHLNDDVKDFGQSPKHDRRRSMKLAKFARMSLCAAASDLPKHCLRLSGSPIKKMSLSSELSECVSFESVTKSTDAFSHILSFLNEGELTHSTSLVCTKWADAAAKSLSTLMLLSVGCDPSFISNADDDDSSVIDDLDSPEMNDDTLTSSSVAKSMEKGWDFLTNCFPWAQYLSDGAFKRVYRVWNERFGAYEAISVMDVDEIKSSGNLSLVGAELAVSVLLSSLSRRNICPNFVITRGVFTCRHEPPSSHWGCDEVRAPQGATFDDNKCSRSICAPEPGECGNYQYIRMELCQHGDMEDYLRKMPGKTLLPCDCQNLLFQMAFALHVAGDRFGLKHYDVKLLNFFLQSAHEPNITKENLTHVVLRYGVGSHIFRLRMHPSTAVIAKLADYGTSILNETNNGQPITLAQFTTFENTPPDYLILGNAAVQGYGHDCFGLGLCMLHLFTGHAPYEEILEEVTCPEKLKGKLRKVWNEKSYDVIRSAMYFVDDNGNETEDDTLYNTLYRYLVLFGIPENQFCSKKHGKVWRVINETLSSSSGPNSKPCPDEATFEKDRKKFSLAEGSNRLIAGARRRLEKMDGAMDILLSLVSFDPKKRAVPLDVINSRFMATLIEDSEVIHNEGDVVKSYTAYMTK